MQTVSNWQGRSTRGFLLGVGAVIMLTTVMEAQAAIFLARRAIGRVEQMSQHSQQKDGPSYDSASVILEASGKQVYATAVQALRSATDRNITITKEDPASLQVQFTNGQQIAGIMISPLGEKLAQMVITSAHNGSQPNAATLVSDGVLRVCREMKVECSRATQ